MAEVLKATHSCRALVQTSLHDHCHWRYRLLSIGISREVMNEAGNDSHTILRLDFNFLYRHRSV